jgi:3-mercaptopyruvate sulfurtransferase SseA
VIEAEDLLPRLDSPQLILVDLSSANRYVSGHIPGARFVEGKRTQLGQPPAPGLLPALGDLEKLFSELGHRNDAVYVVYDDEGGGWAGRFIWLLDVIGHPHYHYLNGGIQAWPADKLSTEVPAPAGPGAPAVAREPTATREYLQSRLGADDLVVWDARGPQEFSGEKSWPPRAGTSPARSTSSGPPAWTTTTCASARTSRSPRTTGHHPRQGSDHPLPDPPPLRLHLPGGQGPRLSTHQGLRRLVGRMGQPPDTPVEV